MASRQVNCAGCRGVIKEDSAFMRCAKCKQYFDILCANFTAEVFTTLTSEFKKMWICFECRSKLPKNDNSQTPVRQQLGHDMSVVSDCLDVSMYSPDNITVRTGKRHAQIPTKCDQSPQNVPHLVHELKQMQDEFESRLTTKICTLLTQQLNEFKTVVLDRINNLVCKIDALEEGMQKTIVDTSVSMHNNTAVVQHSSTSSPAVQYSTVVQRSVDPSSSNPDSRKSKAKNQTSPQQNKKRAAGKANPPSKVSKPAHFLASASTALPSTTDTLSNNAVMEDTEQENSGDWTQVTRRVRERTSLPGVLRGTAAPGTTTLRAAERWRYLHLYYVQEGTTVDQVRAHLQSICGNSDCTVEELKSRGRYSSFKLGVLSKIADSVMSPSNWAEDICVKPWRQNFRGKDQKA